MYKHAIIVLGCGIDAEGNLGPDATVSVQIGIDTLSQSPDSCLVMSGNISYKADFKPSISEAQAMKDYAISLGIPVNRIFVETESKDTLGNFFFTKQNILLPLDITDVTVVRGPNQSDERVTYLARKVLGDGYNFKLIAPNISRTNEQERERTSLALAKKWLDEITDGDTDAIYQLMRSQHPAYNSSLSLEALRELF